MKSSSTTIQWVRKLKKKQLGHINFKRKFFFKKRIFFPPEIDLQFNFTSFLARFSEIAKMIAVILSNLSWLVILE